MWVRFSGTAPVASFAGGEYLYRRWFKWKASGKGKGFVCGCRAGGESASQGCIWFSGEGAIWFGDFPGGVAAFGYAGALFAKNDDLRQEGCLCSMYWYKQGIWMWRSLCGGNGLFSTVWSYRHGEALADGVRTAGKRLRHIHSCSSYHAEAGTSRGGCANEWQGGVCDTKEAGLWTGEAGFLRI